VSFAEGSNATVFLDHLHNFTTVYPCYSPDGEGGVTPGLPASLYSGSAAALSAAASCSLAWISPGRDVRDHCLAALGDQATPLQAYMAGQSGKQTVPELYEHEFGCVRLLGWPEAGLSRVFVEQSRVLSTYLGSDSAYGSFFPTSDLLRWVQDAHHFSTQLQMSDALDEQSRSFMVYLITRSLSEQGLFYARVKVAFSFSAEGTAAARLHTTFSPMIDFSYGTNGHAWVRSLLLNRMEGGREGGKEGGRECCCELLFNVHVFFCCCTHCFLQVFQDVFVWECILLFLFVAFTIREIYQLAMYCREKKKTRAVRPADESSSGNPASERRVRGEERPDKPPLSAPILQIERDKESLLLTEEEPCEHPHPHPHPSPLPHSSHSSALDSPPPPDKSDECRAALRQSSAEDLSCTGADGEDDWGEELEQRVEEAMPDKSAVGNVLDWVTVLIVLSLLGLRAHYITTARLLHELALALAEEHNYSEHLGDLLSRFDSLQRLQEWQRLLCMLVMFVGMTQFFRYLSFDSRLGIVAATVLDSALVLLPVLFIFVIVLVGYSVLGAALFGHEVEAWATVSSSMLNLIIFIVGEYGSYFESKLGQVKLCCAHLLYLYCFYLTCRVTHILTATAVFCEH
jgi:hypothetical protein